MRFGLILPWMRLTKANFMSNKPNAFRNLVITILSEKDGISPELYTALVEYAKQEQPNSCDDVFSAVEQFKSGHRNYTLPQRRRNQLKEVE